LPDFSCRLISKQTQEQLKKLESLLDESEKNIPEVEKVSSQFSLAGLRNRTVSELTDFFNHQFVERLTDLHRGIEILIEQKKSDQNGVFVSFQQATENYTKFNVPVDIIKKLNEPIEIHLGILDQSINRTSEFLRTIQDTIADNQIPYSRTCSFPAELRGHTSANFSPCISPEDQNPLSLTKADQPVLAKKDRPSDQSLYPSVYAETKTEQFPSACMPPTDPKLKSASKVTTGPKPAEKTTSNQGPSDEAHPKLQDQDASSTPKAERTAPAGEVQEPQRVNSENTPQDLLA
jgi:hypothetical protein